jgi:hypothetical protein
MNGTPLKFTFIVTLAVATAASAVAESATMGWQALPSAASYASQPRMTGPTARNKYPEKKGIFKGEFFSRWGCQLTAIHKVRLDQKGNLQSQNVKFTVLPDQAPETVETNRIRQTKVLFETESLSFEPGEAFVLIFKTKVDSPDKEHTDMIMLRITNLFIPS